MMMCMLSVVCVRCLLCRCKHSPSNPVLDEYEYMGSGSGGMALENMTKNPSYLTTREAITSFASGTLTEGDKEREEHMYEMLPSEANQEVQEDATEDMHEHVNQ